MTDLKYCPKCGSETLCWDGSNKWTCPQCGFILYHNCAGAVAVVIRHGDEIMLTRRNQEPGKGRLDLAGGFVDPHESAEQACVRELYEELNLKVDISRLKIIGTLPNVYHYKGIDYNTLDIFFEYKVEAKFQPELDKNELAEIVWQPVSRISIDDIAFESQKKFFRDQYLPDFSSDSK